MYTIKNCQNLYSTDTFFSKKNLLIARRKNRTRNLKAVDQHAKHYCLETLLNVKCLNSIFRANNHHKIEQITKKNMKLVFHRISPLCISI